MVVTLARAFFDESKEGKRWLCVSGYIFEAEKFLVLDSGWKDMLGNLPYFRMSECNAAQGVFKGMTDPECDIKARRAIQLIKQNMSDGIAVSIDMRFADLIPKLGAYKSAYTFACWQCLMGVRTWIQRTKYQGDMAYFFEAGEDSEGEADEIMKGIFRNAELRRAYRYIDHSFADKEKMRGLQCGDLLAWQWLRHVQRMEQGKPDRGDFNALMEREHHFQHYDEKQIRWLKNGVAVQEWKRKNLSILRLGEPSEWLNRAK